MATVTITIVDQDREPGDAPGVDLVGVKVDFAPALNDDVPLTAAQSMGAEMLRSMRHRLADGDLADGDLAETRVSVEVKA